MKSRIVETLDKLSKGDHPIAAELQEELHLNAVQLKSRANETLKNILHNYSSFAVITIDAFFQKVVRSFAREVGVQGSFQVELNQQKVISEVVDKLLAEIGDNKSLTNWLTDFAFYKINEGQSWDTRRDINNLAGELFKELLIREKDHVFGNIEDEHFMPDFMDSLDALVKTFESKLTSMGRQAVDVMKAHGLDQTDFSYGAGGVGGYLVKLANGVVAEPGTRAFQALEEGKWYTKTSKRKGEIDAAVANGLEKILADAIQHWDSHFFTYNTARQIIRNIYTFGLLSEVSGQLNQYRDENDLLLISDFPIFLNNIIRDSDTPFIYEKIGTKYNNYLIDEFQDTSGLQWQNFKPLVKDVVDAGKFSMVVGDIKQSIYRWRGGDWKLLLEKIADDIGEAYTENIPLNSNWRSKKNIVQFNNDLFSKLPEIIHTHFLKEAGTGIAEIDNIRKAYAEVKQDHVEGDKSTGGLIDIRFLEKDEHENTRDIALEHLIAIVERLQDAHFHLRDIAILIRNKHDGKLITEALMQHEASSESTRYRYDIISNESLFLKNSPVVHFLICAMKMLSNPTEKVYQTELIYSWYLYLNNEEPGPLETYHGRDDDPLEVLENERGALLTLNLLDQTEALIRIFHLDKEKDQMAYLLAFQDAVLDFYERDNAGIEGFLQWWEENNDRAIQVSDDMEAIRLMTIHKSKGLQFKVVIVPFCNWKMDHSPIHENIVWCDTRDTAPFSKLPYLPLKYKKDMGKSIFGADYWDEKVKAYVDNLNLLYVACTRAEEALYIMADYDGKKRGANSGVNDLVHSYLVNNLQEGWVVDENHYTFGKDVTYSVYEGGPDREEYALECFISNPWQERKDLTIRSAQFISNQEVISRINEGVVVHEILSKVILRKDFDKALKCAETEFGLGTEELLTIKQKLRGLFSMPQVNDWFSDNWTVKSEMNIILGNGDVKRPDRVMLKSDGVVVVDFKTGEEREENNRQVEEYKEILQSMGYNPVEGYLLYINQNKVEQV